MSSHFHNVLFEIAPCPLRNWCSNSGCKLMLWDDRQKDYGDFERYFSRCFITSTFF